MTVEPLHLIYPLTAGAAACALFVRFHIRTRHPRRRPFTPEQLAGRHTMLDFERRDMGWSDARGWVVMYCHEAIGSVDYNVRAGRWHWQVDYDLVPEDWHGKTGGACTSLADGGRCIAAVLGFAVEVD